MRFQGPLGKRGPRYLSRLSWSGVATVNLNVESAANLLGNAWVCNGGCGPEVLQGSQTTPPTDRAPETGAIWDQAKKQKW